MVKQLLIALMLTSVAVPSYGSSLKEIGAATYQLYVDGEFACSGTFITKTKMLTAAHCIPKTGKHDYNIRVNVEKDHKVISSTLVYMENDKLDRTADVATMVLMDPNSALTIEPIDVATVEELNKALEFGTHLVAVGYPLNMGKHISEGRYSGLEYLIDPGAGIKSDFYKTSVHIMPGSSGGAAYIEIDSEWKLMGTAFGLDEFNVGVVRVPVSFMTYFSTIESIHKIL